VIEEDKLFATLDPTTRRLRLPTNQNVLLSDTVGFIRKLPHTLVDSFKATLEEVVNADLLLHVVDISHPQAEEQVLAVNQVLAEIGAGEKPVLLVFNKIDRFENGEFVQGWLGRFPGAVAISAKTRAGFEALVTELGVDFVPSASTSNWPSHMPRRAWSPDSTPSARSSNGVTTAMWRGSRPGSPPTCTRNSRRSSLHNFKSEGRYAPSIDGWTGATGRRTRLGDGGAGSGFAHEHPLSDLVRNLHGMGRHLGRAERATP